MPKEKPPLSLNLLRREGAGFAANPTTTAENQLEKRLRSKRCAGRPGLATEGPKRRRRRGRRGHAAPPARREEATGHTCMEGAKSTP